MKKIIIAFIAVLFISSAQAQEFKKNLATAQTSYAAGKLQDAHFALQQIMQDLDITLGKEIMKLFPATMDSLKAIANSDNVSGSSGFAGVNIQRNYGSENHKAELNIVINSPLLNGLNAYLASPILGAFGSDPNSKLIKVNGQKGRLTKESVSEDQKTTSYRIEIPLSNALLTLQCNSSSEKEMLAFANTIPLSQISQLLQ